RSSGHVASALGRRFRPLGALPAGALTLRGRQRKIADPGMVVVVIGGVLAGYLAGGRLRRLADLRLRWLWLLALATVVVLGMQVAGWGGAWSVLIGGTLLLVFLAANGWTQPGGIR